MLIKSAPPPGGINSTWKKNREEEIQLEKNNDKLSTFLYFMDIVPVFDEFSPYFPFQLSILIFLLNLMQNSEKC